MRSIVLSNLLLILSLAISALGQGPTEWTTLSGEDGEFSVTIPGRYDVYRSRDGNTFRVSGSAEGAFYDLAFEFKYARVRMEQYRRHPAIRAEETFVSKGNAQVLSSRLKDEKGYQVVLMVGSDKGLYSIYASSASAGNPTMEAILASVRFENAQVARDTNVSVPKTGVEVKIRSLESTELIKKALRYEQEGKIEIVRRTKDERISDRDKFYSRRLVVLEKPRPAYADEARRNLVSGTVVLKVLFNGSGGIVRIAVVKGLPDGLTDSAIRAAKQIKVLPAQVLGQPVDAEATVEYSFSFS